MRIGLLILLGIVLGVPLLLFWSARSGLDRAMQHTRATEALPKLAPGTSNGLVQIDANGMTFRARVAGLEGDGPGLVLLHGFPESSIMWTPLIEAAAAAGFRVVAFDQRGYSPGARPDAVADYALDALISDLLAVADAVGFETFHLGVHDWGSVVGWLGAAAHPGRIQSLFSLSIPHPGAIPVPGAPTTTPTYIKVFRATGVAETLLGFGRRRMMHRSVYASMSASHRAEYESIFSEPGALSAALNWYRAMDPANLEAAAEAVVHQPVLYVYGRRDMPVYVAPSVQERVPAFVDGPFESGALDAGHWLIQDEEKAVVDAVLAHLQRVR